MTTEANLADVSVEKAVAERESIVARLERGEVSPVS